MFVKEQFEGFPYRIALNSNGKSTMQSYNSYKELERTCCICPYL